MIVLSRASAIVTLSLLTSAATAHAECAWVLWDQETLLFRKDGTLPGVSAGSTGESWSIVDTTETKSACETRGAEMLRTVYGQSTPGVEVTTGPMWAHERSPA
jgi:hypothetical protein